MSNRWAPRARPALSGMMGRWRAGACPPRDAMTLRSLLSTSTSVTFGKLCALSAAACLCALPACGDDDTGPIVSPDAGTDLGPPDLGTPDLGPMYAPGTTCDDPHVLAGTTTGEVTL